MIIKRKHRWTLDNNRDRGMQPAIEINQSDNNG